MIGVLGEVGTGDRSSGVKGNDTRSGVVWQECVGLYNVITSTGLCRTAGNEGLQLLC